MKRFLELLARLFRRPTVVLGGVTRVVSYPYVHTTVRGGIWAGGRCIKPPTITRRLTFNPRGHVLIASGTFFGTDEEAR